MEATPEQSAEGLALVHVLSTVLDRLVVANAAIARTDPGQVTKFHAMKAPGIGILQYLERIHKYASCSNECFILALIYIDRLIQRNNFLLTELNVHRVVITSVLLAAKFFDDAYYNNAYYAKVGGVLVSEMNGLEVDFLFRINFSLHVTPEIFDKYRAELLLQATVAVAPSPLVPSPTLPSLPRQPSPVSPPPSCNPQAPTTQQQEHMNASMCQVTPSPQADAARVVYEAQLIAAKAAEANISFPFHFTENAGFVQVQRANSMPKAVPSMTYVPRRASPGLCAQQSSYSAPAIITPGAALHYPGHFAAGGEDYVMIENTLFPLQNTLIHHHHHGNYAAATTTETDPRYHAAAAQMLAGAGL